MGYYLERTAIPSNPIDYGQLAYCLGIDNDVDEQTRANLMAFAADALAMAEDITGSTLVRRNLEPVPQLN